MKLAHGVLLVTLATLVTASCADESAPVGDATSWRSQATDPNGAAGTASADEADRPPRGPTRSERPRIDRRAKLDLTSLPDGVTAEIDGYPVTGMLVVEVGPVDLAFHHGGRLLRRVDLVARAGETTTPDLDWMPEAIAALRRHTRLHGGVGVIDVGLAWLVDHRESDGSWRADTFARHCPEGTSCGDGTERISPIETTGLALLTLLGSGETHRIGQYRSSVRTALDFLIGAQRDDGLLATPQRLDGTRAHAIGTLALTEAHALSGSPRFRRSAQAALNALIALRRPGSGWTPGPDSRRPDAETSAWAAFAIASAAEGDLDLPPGLRDELQSDLQLFGDPGSATLSLRLSGMLTLARIELGAPDTDPAVASGLERILASPPSADAPIDPMAVFFGATVVFRVGGKGAWKKWSRNLKGLVVSPGFDDRSLLKHHPAPETAPDAIALGRLRATLYRKLVGVVYYRYGRVFGAAPR